MQSLRWWAEPWWVNLLALVPFVMFFYGRRNPLNLSGKVLFFAGCFAVAFGYVEGSVVVYLRGALGMLPGIGGTLADVTRLSSSVYQQAYTIDQFPKSLMKVETVREAATMVMLISVAWLSGRRWPDRWAMFLFTFALWDLSYYASLRITIGWPVSLQDVDVLFLIPVPWIARVWFPLLISGLTTLAVVIGSLPGVLHPAMEAPVAEQSQFS